MYTKPINWSSQYNLLLLTKLSLANMMFHHDDRASLGGRLWLYYIVSDTQIFSFYQKTYLFSLDFLIELLSSPVKFTYFALLSPCKKSALRSPLSPLGGGLHTQNNQFQGTLATGRWFSSLICSMQFDLYIYYCKVSLIATSFNMHVFLLQTIYLSCYYRDERNVQIFL